jgi:hypothetical protein
VEGCIVLAAAAVRAATISIPIRIPTATAVAAAAVAIAIHPHILGAVVLLTALTRVVVVHAGAICRAVSIARAAARCIPALTKGCLDCC